MRYDFDTAVDRRNTYSIKHDFKEENGMPEDVIPLWVADMDFRTAPEILERLQKVLAHGVLGYSDSMGGYYEAAAGWYDRHFGWRPQEEWLVKTPGIVFALYMAVQAFTEEGEGVLIQPPVYHPFRESILDSGRKLVNSPLKLADGHYEMDFEDFERKIVEEQVRLFLLCSPHNPVGRVWTEEELRRVGDICRKHQVIVVSDEIHADFTYGGRRQICFAGLSEAYEQNCVVCTAPSKTFNLAGLQVSNIYIPNPELRKRFQDQVARTGFHNVGLMGIAACQAAYEEGEPWLCALREYLEENVAFVRSFLREELPEVRLTEPEGTYLLWLDLRAWKLTAEERTELLSEKARIWVNDGALFGSEGEGFIRVNIACPRSVLREAFERLRDAVRG